MNVRHYLNPSPLIRAILLRWGTSLFGIKIANLFRNHLTHVMNKKRLLMHPFVQTRKFYNELH